MCSIYGVHHRGLLVPAIGNRADEQIRHEPNREDAEQGGPVVGCDELSWGACVWPACRCSAVSAPSSLAVDLASQSGLTLVAFLRGESMNVYTRPDRVKRW